MSTNGRRSRRCLEQPGDNGDLSPLDHSCRTSFFALAVFNDVILQVALARNLDVIDLRAVCSTPSDFANPIEPSAVGGEKIVALGSRECRQLKTYATAQASNGQWTKPLRGIRFAINAPA